MLLEVEMLVSALPAAANQSGGRTPAAKRCDSQRNLLALGVALGVAAALALGVALAVDVIADVGVAVRLAVGELLGVALGVGGGLAVLVCVGVRVTVTLCVGCGLAVHVDVGVGVAVTLGVGGGLAVLVGVGVGVAELVGEELAEGVALRLALELAAAVGDSDMESVALGEGVGEALRLTAVALAVLLVVGAALTEGEGVMVGVAVAVGVPLGVALVLGMMLSLRMRGESTSRMLPSAASAICDTLELNRAPSAVPQFEGAARLGQSPLQPAVDAVQLPAMVVTQLVPLTTRRTHVASPSLYNRSPAESMASPTMAAAGVARAAPAAVGGTARSPLPAIVDSIQAPVALCGGVSLRTLKPEYSATNSAPERGSNTSAIGWVSQRVLAKPSELLRHSAVRGADSMGPTMVVTKPRSRKRRTRQFRISAKKISPLVWMARLRTFLMAAEETVAFSAHEFPPPHIVVIMPSAATLRMTEFPSSLSTSAPAPSTARPEGELNDADVAAP